MVNFTCSFWRATMSPAPVPVPFLKSYHVSFTCSLLKSYHVSLTCSLVESYHVSFTLCSLLKSYTMSVLYLLLSEKVLCQFYLFLSKELPHQFYISYIPHSLFWSTYCSLEKPLVRSTMPSPVTSTDSSF